MSHEDEESPGREFASTEAAERVEPHGEGSVGPYRLLQRLGEGGMGEVWLAQQTEPVRRTVALKMIKAGMDSKQVLARFEAERQALALMDHPAVAKVFDAGTTEQGRPYFVMEYVKGLPITEYCDRHKLTYRERLELFQQVCEGVQHAHQKAVIHRDLKPSNVLVAEQDGKPAPRIIDFGLAKATAQRLTEKTMFTELGVLVGTPEYMSPEQADLTGEGVDTRTDVYSLGVILYELLVGVLPFDSKELRSAGLEGIRRKIREEEPVRPSSRVSSGGATSRESAVSRGVDLRTLQRQVSGDLDWITLRALEKDRARRYGSPTELAADIRRHLNDEPVLATPPSVPYRMGKFARRHRAAVVAGSLLLLTLLGGIAGTTVGLVRAKRAEAEAKLRLEASERSSRFLGAMLTNVDPIRMGQELRSDLDRRVAAAGSLGAVNMLDVARGVVDRELLVRAGDMINKRLDKDPALAARLRLLIGYSYSNLQLEDSAMVAFRKAIELTRQAGPSDSIGRLAKKALAIRLTVVGGRKNSEEGVSLIEGLLPEVRAGVGEDGTDYLRLRYQRTVAYTNLGDFEKAEPELRDLIPRLRRGGAPDSALLGVALNGLGLTLSRQPDKRAEAEPPFREAVEVLSRRLGPGHFETINSRNNLANLLGLMHRDAEQVEYLRDVVDVARRNLGDDSRYTVRTVEMLGMALMRLGRIEEAIALYEGVIRARQPNSAMTRAVATATINVAATLAGMNHRAEAEKQLAGLERELRSNRPASLDVSYGTTLYNLACLAALRGARASALDLMGRAVDLGSIVASQLEQDTDLASLRGPDLDVLIARAKAKAGTPR
jgi:non-specific serine/threonine protein kinase/serine/threonine-protein kinase